MVMTAESNAQFDAEDNAKERAVFQEITPGYPVGGTSAEALGNMAAAMSGVSRTVEVAEEGLWALAYSMEFLHLQYNFSFRY